MAKTPVAIVGGESLAGNEVREVIRDRRLAASVTLVGSEDPGTAVLTERGGEAVVLTGLDLDRLADARVVFLAGSYASSHKVRELMGSACSALLVDLSGHLEEEASARLRAPWVEAAALPVLDASCIQVVAHPAAILLAMVLRRLAASLPVARSVANIFEPASERGRAGVEELQKQTIQLLSFKPFDKPVFDAQLSFVMLARYGSDAPLALSTVEQRIERHLASLLAAAPGAPPMPSLRLIQAPVMHAYTTSLWVEFHSRPDLAAVFAALQSNRIDVRGDDLDPPDNVGVAGQSGLSIGALEVDRNNPYALWLWAAADNLRIHAENAVEIALPWLEAGAVQ